MPLRGRQAGNITVVPLSTPDEWVEIKTRLSRGDQLALQAGIMQDASIKGDLMRLRNMPELDENDPDAAASMLDLSGMKIATMLDGIEFTKLEVAIVDWSFAHLDPTDENYAALTPAALRDLDEDDVAIISAKMTELYARSEADRQD